MVIFLDVNFRLETKKQLVPKQLGTCSQSSGQAKSMADQSSGRVQSYRPEFWPDPKTLHLLPNASRINGLA